MKWSNLAVDNLHHSNLLQLSEQPLLCSFADVASNTTDHILSSGILNTLYVYLYATALSVEWASLEWRTTRIVEKHQM